MRAVRKENKTCEYASLLCMSNVSTSYVPRLKPPRNSKREGASMKRRGKDKDKSRKSFYEQRESKQSRAHSSIPKPPRWGEVALDLQHRKNLCLWAVARK